jgi:DNA-binding NarL/FixJ family response regulator
MNIIILTPVRLLGDGLASCFSNRPDMNTLGVLNDLGALRETLAKTATDVVLIDVTQGVDLFDVRAIASEWPDVALVALGLNEQRQEVIRCGKAGFAGYVARDASIDGLCQSLSEIVAGRLACPPEIAGGLLRALFGREPRAQESDLHLSLTVKHHVHHVLEKLQLQRRAQAMRKVREAPWIARVVSVGRK